MSVREVPGLGNDTIKLVDASTGNETVYLPANFAVSRKLIVRRSDSSANTVAVALFSASDTLDGVTNGTQTVGPGGESVYMPRESGQWVSFGAGAEFAKLPDKFAPKLKTQARTLLAHVPDPAKVYQLWPGSVTITSGANNGATTITGAVRRNLRPKNVGGPESNQQADVANDPTIRFLGLGNGITPVFDSLSAGFCGVQYPLLTGGASQAARWRTKWSLIHTGSVIEFIFKSFGTSNRYRLSVDGQRVAEDMTSISGYINGNLGTLKFDFTTGGTRRLDLEMDGPLLAGVYIESTATVHRAPPGKVRLATFGDSHVGGADGVNAYDTFTPRLADLIGADEWLNLGIGGSKFNIVNPGGIAPDFRNRLGDIVAANPHVLLYYGSYNDAVSITGDTQQAALQAEAVYCLSAIKAALPEAIVIVAGCHPSATPTANTVQRANAAVKAAAAAVGYQFIDTQDPLGAADTAPAWTSGVYYPFGAIVVNGGAVYQCISGHTAGGSFDATKFRGTSWIFGTGREGSTTGDGNADIYTNSGGVHMTLAGHKYMARRFAAAIIRQLEILAA